MLSKAHMQIAKVLRFVVIWAVSCLLAFEEVTKFSTPINVSITLKFMAFYSY